MDRSVEQPLDIRTPGRGDARLQGVTEAAHVTTDKVARAATVQVDRLRGTAHEAVDGAASLVESASASIRARPMTAVASVLAVGYLLGWLTRR
jgi:ElaB/YqjD/DUF883 family membrane-anchored ribosome-binding protein